MQLNNNQFIKQLYLVFLLNLLVVFIISKSYIDYLEFSGGFFPKIYFLLNTVGHFGLLTLFPLLLTLLIFWITKARKASKIVFSTLSVFFILVLKLDANIFSQFRYHLSPLVFNLMFGKRASDTFQFSLYNILMAIFFIALIIALQFLFYFIAKKIVLRRENLKIKITSISFVILLLFTNLTYAWADVNFYRPITQYKNIYPAFYPLTAESLMLKLNLVDAEKIAKNNAINDMIEENGLQYPLHPIVTSESKKKKNILFLIIDSWRFDCMTPEITPNIYNLSQKSQHFLNHKSGSNMTTGGIFTLFYGIPATYFESFTGVGKSPIFMDELRKQNYELGIFGSSTLENPPFNRNVFANIPNLRLFSKGNTPSERDIEITNEWMAKIDTQEANKPFFGYLFYDAAHGFDYPKDYKTPFKPSLEEVDYLELDDDYDSKPLVNRYKNSLHFIDNEIGKIIKQLEEKNLLENTIIVITGDHGQEFNDNKKGYWQHGGNFSKYQIQVPMLVFDFSKPKKQYNHLTLHYDIAPTLMTSVLGVKNPIADYSSGQDLYNTKERDWFVCGYNQKYSVIEKTKITNIHASGLFDILDKNLNPIEEDLNYDIIGKALEITNQYYAKEAKK
ncbi:DUF3413 domain-containing protein [Flavobacterium sp. PLA-1-15]|uniref:DUF3413 domain-containing protein n=1 Tax=Flavobacterium sp. PLA-1-15 TaxID=3380533 RepID=UPI003B7AEC81